MKGLTKGLDVCQYMWKYADKHNMIYDMRRLSAEESQGLLEKGSPRSGQCLWQGAGTEILRGQPEPPLYFARMKRHNRIGPELLDGIPEPRKTRRS